MKKLGHYRYAVNYADFGFPYSKETYLFSNLFLPFSTKKVHSNSPGLLSINSKYQRSKVPPALIQSILLFLPWLYVLQHVLYFSNRLKTVKFRI